MKPLDCLKITAVLIASSLASTVVAQPARENQERRPPPQSRPQNDGPRGERSFSPPQGGMPFEQILNDEQRREFFEAMQSNREKMREMGERQQKLRAEMQDSMFADQLDEEAIRKRAAEMAEIDAQRQIFQGRAFQKVRPSLSPEQLKQFKKIREEMGRVREQRRDQFFEQRREQFEKRGGESIGPKPEGGSERPGNPDRPNRSKPEARAREEFRPERQLVRPEFAQREERLPARRYDSAGPESRSDFGPRPQAEGRGPRLENRDREFSPPTPRGPRGFRRDSEPPRGEMRRREQSRPMEERPEGRGDLPPPGRP